MSRSQILVLVFAASNIWAEGRPSQLNYNFGDRREVDEQVTEASTYVSGLDLTTVANCREACKNFRLPEDPSCFERYSRIFDGPKPVVDIRIVYGMKNEDTGSLAFDVYLKLGIYDQLIKPCPPNATDSNVFACGFQRKSSDNGNYLVLERPTRTPSGRTKTVRITLAHSSVDPDIKTVDPVEQANKSADAEKLFLDGLCESQAVIYDGHGRNGSGPDFDLPKLTRGKIDYSKYHGEGLAKVVKRLASCPESQTPYLTLISCGYRNFPPAIKGVAPRTTLQMSSGHSYTKDDPYLIYGTINGLLGQICEPGYSRSINAPVISTESYSRIY